MLDSVIFDLDGTLWDTPEICARAWNEALSSRNLPFRRLESADIAALMGLTAEEIRARIFPDLPVPEGREHLRACFRQEILRLKENGGRLYPGVKEGLRTLAARVPLFIVSNCDPPYLEVFLDSSGLRDCFRDWECHGATSLSKGENLVLLRERNGLSSSLFIGDTAGDQKAAEHAGVPFGFVSYGFGKCTASQFQFGHFSEIVRAGLELAGRREP